MGDKDNKSFSAGYMGIRDPSHFPTGSAAQLGAMTRNAEAATRAHRAHLDNMSKLNDAAQKRTPSTGSGSSLGYVPPKSNGKLPEPLVVFSIVIGANWALWSGLSFLDSKLSPTPPPTDGNCHYGQLYDAEAKSCFTLGEGVNSGADAPVHPRQHYRHRHHHHRL